MLTIYGSNQAALNRPLMKYYKQVAALPLMEAPELKICLVTSRETGRWVLPKGWAKAGVKDHEMVEIEAREEAGLLGDTQVPSIGIYTYSKKLHTFASITCKVDVYAFKVHQQLEDWPERQQRQRKWFTIEEAAKLVEESELRVLLETYHTAVYGSKAS